MDISELKVNETANMAVMSCGAPTSWIWTFAGPGHEKAVRQKKRLACEQIKKQREILLRPSLVSESDPEKELAEIQEQNLQLVLERLIGWSDAMMNGKPFRFTEDNARLLLADPSMEGLREQATLFLLDPKSFWQDKDKPKEPAPETAPAMEQGEGEPKHEQDTAAGKAA